LRPYKSEVAKALEAVARLNPEFVKNTISDLQIREQFKPIADDAIARTQQILRAV
jgi:hypothetical protein